MLHRSPVKPAAQPNPTPKGELHVVELQLARALGRCISEFSLIEAGDRVMVCMSGGKDSYAMMQLLERFRRKAPFDFELLAVHLDQQQPGYDGAPLRDWLQASGYAHKILREDTYSVVIKHIPAGKTYCSLCSRLRRGILYRAASELGCTKIALGHHRDDAIETLLLNLTYTGALASMPPKLLSRDRKHTVIRPLMYAKEAVLARYAELMHFPILPCNLCGSQEQLKRKRMKALLTEIETFAPQARDSMLAAMGNVKARHLFDQSLQGEVAIDTEDDDTDMLAAPRAAISPALLVPDVADEDAVESAADPLVESPPLHARAVRRLPLVTRDLVEE